MDFNFNSPEEEICYPGLEKYDVRLFIKRDDMIHPFISGNKWRKLKYILQKAVSENKSHLITFGGAYSNHLLATACASAKFGFKATAFVRGEDKSNHVLMLCRMFGMKLIFVGRESYRDKKLLYKTHFQTDTCSFFIDEGGYSTEAVKGCEELAAELLNTYDHVFCAAGTGATAAGLINGLHTINPKTKVHVIPILKGAGFLIEAINSFLKEKSDFEFHPDYHFGGYAKTTVELLNFMNDFASKTGIMLDQVYTGKMMYAVFDQIKNEHLKNGSKILAIHTGGLTGLLGLSGQILNKQ